jgi:myo-inositol 2-dehydrogenase/D-chiro-inositol 1-dehydrogenase
LTAKKGYEIVAIRSSVTVSTIEHDGDQPASRRRVRLGLAGLGRIGRMHAANLAGRIPSVELVRVVDVDEGLARSTGQRLGVGWSTSYDDLLDDPSVEGVVVATPTPLHAPLVEQAARAGKHAFCEKPVALDLALLDSLLEEVERAGILFQVGFQRRFDAGYRAAHDAVARGALGNLLLLRAATHDPMPPAEGYLATSGGIFSDLHIHDLDAIRFVTEQEIDEVYADGSVRETAWLEKLGDVDAAVAALRLADGTLAVLTGTRHDPLGYDVRLEVFGTRDSVVVGMDVRTPLRSLEPGAPAAPADAYPDFLERFEDAYRAELEAFAATLRDGGPSACTLADARAALAAALAAARSRAERRPVSIEEVTTGAETLAG